MKCLKLLTFILLVAYTQNADAQRNKISTKAYFTYEAGEYKKAVDLFKDAYNQTSDNEAKNEIVYLIADCFYRTNDPKKAEMWYKKAIARGYNNPEVFLRYAQSLKMNEKYEDAIMQFQKYKDFVPDDPRGENGIRSCELAMEWLSKPNGYIVEEMKFFNSKENDFSPYFARSDYGVVFLTSSRDASTGSEVHGATNENFTDIYTSTIDRKGSWSEPVPLNEEVNSEFEDGTPILSPDYNSLYFTRCRASKNKNLGCEIFISQREGETWGKASALAIASDSIVVAHPALSSDELTLYFVSDMEGGYGEMDIWKVTRSNKSAPWGQAVNLGEPINTEGREVYPYVHPDGTLYFASDGHLGMGGLDIYKVKTTDDGKVEVVNMQHPINSPSDDFGIVFENDIERGYFTSSRTPRGDDNIFMFMLPPLRFSIAGTVKDEKNEEPLDGAIVKSISSDGMTLETTTSENGQFRFLLKPGTDYLFIASRDGFLNGKERETTKGISESTEFRTTILLSSIEEPIELPNIIYDFESADLRPESMVILDRFVETLNDNPNITIELMSHTDARGSDDFNLELSQRRAQSVVEYLIKNGIADDRLTAKGYGETQPRIVDEKSAEQNAFLKAGNSLSEEFINNLSSEMEQEIAHQLNRRTEFKVLRTDYVPAE